MEELPSPSIKQPGEIIPGPLTPTTQIMVVTKSWTQDFIDYIKGNKLPANTYIEELRHQEYFSNVSQGKKEKKS
jgi:hypothetical protein